MQPNVLHVMCTALFTTYGLEFRKPRIANVVLMPMWFFCESMDVVDVLNIARIIAAIIAQCL